MSGVESISKMIIILMHIQHSYEYIEKLSSVCHIGDCVDFLKKVWSLFMASNTSSLMASWTRATNEEKKIKKFIHPKWTALPNERMMKELFKKKFFFILVHDCMDLFSPITNHFIILPKFSAFLNWLIVRFYGPDCMWI